MSEETEPVGTGLCCFKDGRRLCGPDCMAWLSSSPEGPDYRAPDGEPFQWARCLVLVNTHKTGKHLVHIAANLNSVLRAVSGSPPPNVAEIVKSHGL